MMIFSTSGDRVGRILGTELNGNADFSLLLRVRTLLSNPTSGYRAFYVLKNTAGTNLLGFYQGTSGHVTFEATNGSTIEIDGGALTVETNYFLGITYNNTTNLFSFYVNGLLAGSDTLDIGATFDNQFMGDDTLGGFANLAAGYFRSWQRLLTPAEMATEMGSLVVVDDTDLFESVPLETNYIEYDSLQNWGRLAGTPYFEYVDQASDLTYTTNPLLVYPSAAGGVSVTPSGSSLGNSDWAEISSDTPAEWAIVGLAVKPGINPGDFTVELGVGTAGNEVVIGTYSGSLNSQLSPPAGQTPDCRLLIPVPVVVASGSRLVWRLRKLGTDTTAWTLKLNYYETPLAGNGTLATTTAAAARLTKVSVTPNGSDGANSAWAEYSAALTADTLVTAITAYPPAANSNWFEVDIGVGTAGNEVVVCTVKSDTLNSTALAYGGMYQFIIRPYISIADGSRVAIRMRKQGTSTTGWAFSLLTYADVAIADLTTAEVMQWLPSADNLLSLGSGGSWLNQAWQELSAGGLSESSVVAALLPRNDVTNATYEIDVGYGVSGSEVVVATVRVAGGALTSTAGRYQWLPVASKVIPADTRIVARARVAAAGQTIAVAVGFVPSPDFLDYGAVAAILPPSADPVQEAGAGSAWANSSYEIVGVIPARSLLTGLGVRSGLTEIDLEVDVAIGTPGSEAVITTFALYKGGDGGGAFWYTIPGYPRYIDTTSLVSVRCRKPGTDTGALFFSLSYIPAGALAVPPDSGNNGPAGIANAVTVPVVRLRRAPHLADEQQRIFYSKFQLDIEAGVGTVTGQGQTPELLLRWSDDGGFTWSDWRTLGVGSLGAYRYRCIARRLGMARDRMFEVRQSDPVKTAWLDAYLDFEGGTS